MNKEQFLKLVDIFEVEYSITRRDITVSDEPEKIARFKEVCEIFLDSITKLGLFHTLQGEGHWKEFTIENNKFSEPSKLTTEKFYKLANSLNLNPYLASSLPRYQPNPDIGDEIIIDAPHRFTIEKFALTCEVFFPNIDYSISIRDFHSHCYIRASIFDEMKKAYDEQIIKDELRNRCGQPDMVGCIANFDYDNLEDFEQIDSDEEQDERVYSFVVEAWFTYSIDLSKYFPYPAKPDPTEKDSHEKAMYHLTLQGDNVTDFDYQGALKVLEPEEE